MFLTLFVIFGVTDSFRGARAGDEQRDIACRCVKPISKAVPNERNIPKRLERKQHTDKQARLVSPS